MLAELFRPEPLVLGPTAPFKREAVRPLDQRPPGFAEAFDSDTLFFDGFLNEAGDRAILVAPAFFNLLPAMEQMSATAMPSGQSVLPKLLNLDRHARITLSVPKGTQALSLATLLGRFTVALKPNRSAFFSGRRVLFTKSKNNRLEWIKDWVRYHRDIHGADAVLFYDNNSTDYAPEHVLDALSSISGIQRAAVVDWKFKFGPQGTMSGLWDSDFCELGVLEHGRWFYLQEAASVLHGDVDELVVAADKTSVFETAEKSRFGVLRYPGVWVYGFLGQKELEPPPRFTHYDHFLQPRRTLRRGFIPSVKNACPGKWTAVPAKTPAGAQWTTHAIKGWLPARLTNTNFAYRHFREINNHWKYDRHLRVAYDPERYAYDDSLLANFARVRWAA